MKSQLRWLSLTRWKFMGENEKKQMKEDIAVQDAVTLIVDASVEG